MPTPQVDFTLAERDLETLNQDGPPESLQRLLSRIEDRYGVTTRELFLDCLHDIAELLDPAHGQFALLIEITEQPTLLVTLTDKLSNLKETQLVAVLTEYGNSTAAPCFTLQALIGGVFRLEFVAPVQVEEVPLSMPAVEAVEPEEAVKADEPGQNTEPKIERFELLPDDDGRLSGTFEVIGAVQDSFCDDLCYSFTGFLAKVEEVNADQPSCDAIKVNVTVREGHLHISIHDQHQTVQVHDLDWISDAWLPTPVGYNHRIRRNKNSVLYDFYKRNIS